MKNERDIENPQAAALLVAVLRHKYFPMLNVHPVASNAALILSHYRHETKSERPKDEEGKPVKFNEGIIR